LTADADLSFPTHWQSNRAAWLQRRCLCLLQAPCHSATLGASTPFLPAIATCWSRTHTYPPHQPDVHEQGHGSGPADHRHRLGASRPHQVALLIPAGFIKLPHAEGSNVGPQRRGKKICVLDHNVSSFLGLITEVALLREHGVEQCASATPPHHCCPHRPIDRIACC